MAAVDDEDGGYVATVHVAGGVASPPVTVVVVVGTMARARQLERLMADPGFVVKGVARDADTAERMVLDTRPAAVPSHTFPDRSTARAVTRSAGGR